ncbi:hypothetical protein GQ37_024425 [Janthinobacterium sp. BJB1]|nr:hypothetical protein GQ37_024425 [Janthinobacterium sp. BJB1]
MRQARQEAQGTAQQTSAPRQASETPPALADLRPSTLARQHLAQLMADGPRMAQRKSQSAMIPGASPPAHAGVGLNANRTGLPDRLKSGMENLSGMALDDVRVHYNSARPAQLQALAYAQGNEIHVAPGQEAHVPHEAWHVVQQKQGRVRATLQAKGVPLNDERHLEEEADIMGQRALAAHDAPAQAVLQPGAAAGYSVQRKRPAPAGAAYVDMTSEEVWLSPLLSQRGHLFSKTLPLAADRATLLQQLTVEGETVGHDHSAVAWNTKAQDYDKPEIAAIDPFRIRLGGTYGAALAPTTLELDYHFGGFNMGYVVKVRDHGAVAAMENRGRRGGAQAGLSPTYSNQHHALGDDGLMASAGTLGATIVSSEQAFDSTTKLAGEGARFRCVQRHQGALTDNSKFFIRLDDSNMAWVTFNTLWLTWSATFGKIFGISDDAVATALKDNGLQKIGVGGIGVVAVPRGHGPASNITAARDYNLESRAPAVARDCTDFIMLRVNDRHGHAGKKTRISAISASLTSALDTMDQVESYATYGGKGKSWDVKVWNNGGRAALTNAFLTPALAGLVIADP